jgi:hypothetical protein
VIFTLLSFNSAITETGSFAVLLNESAGHLQLLTKLLSLEPHYQRRIDG